MRPESTAGRPPAVLVFALFLISAVDLYFPAIGLPVVPLSGVILLAAFDFTQPRESARDDRGMVVLFLTLAAITLLSGIWALVYFAELQLKGPVGMAIGLGAAWLVTRTRIDRDTLLAALSVVVVIHLGFWALQLALIVVTGQPVDLIGPITGIPTRSFYIYFTRPTGLFSEPATMALFFFFGLTARLVHHGFRIRALDAVILLAILSSMSISGYFLTAGALGITLLNASRREAWRLGLGAVAAVTIAVAIAWQLEPKLVQFVFSRASAPLSDASGAVRGTGVIRGLLAKDEIVQTFGIGMGNYAQSTAIVSGIQNMFEAFGFAGGLAFFCAFAALFFVSGASLSIFAIWTLSLLASGIWTAMMWWTWTGLLLLSGPVRAARTGPRLDLLPHRANPT